jgi:hypothetical protein
MVVTEKIANDSQATVSICHICHAVNLCLRFSGVRGPFTSMTESHNSKYCDNESTEYRQINDMTAIGQVPVIHTSGYSRDCC